MLLTTMSTAAQLGGGRVDECRQTVAGGQVARHAHGPAAEALDLNGHGGELIGRTGADHHIGTGFGERGGSGGADASAGSGHDRHLVVDSELLEHHARLISPSGPFGAP